MREESEELNESAAMAARLLRVEVPVRGAWRDALLSRIDADARSNQRASGWRINPPMAIAASLFFIVLGATGATMVARATRPVAVSSAEVAVPATVRFVFVAPAAANVSVVGDFNQWAPGVAPLRRLSDGRTWIADVPLAPGRYAYAFVVDGKLQPDPTAPSAADGDFGVANSIIMVRGS